MFNPMSRLKVIDLSKTPKSPNANLADTIFFAYASGGGQQTIDGEGQINWNELWSALDTKRAIRIVSPVEINGTKFVIQTDEVTVVYMNETPAMLAYNFMMNYNNSLTQVKVVLNYQGANRAVLTVVVEPVTMPPST